MCGAVVWVGVLEVEDLLDLRQGADVMQHDHKRCLQLLLGVRGVEQFGVEFVCGQGRHKGGGVGRYAYAAVGEERLAA